MDMSWNVPANGMHVRSFSDQSFFTVKKGTGELPIQARDGKVMSTPLLMDPFHARFNLTFPPCMSPIAPSSVLWPFRLSWLLEISRKPLDN
ncbi:hypothetical protein CEXT_657071 [Caerostris extrusa]|uniref:Uncharacterized protein n=1 Tax=Caerostris extrusa TaxID=172846 RepID=A0AAV4M7X8_CAEEX|nr:hypothetical protein CEXT_657071 [Caerostris extrusa]